MLKKNLLFCFVLLISIINADAQAFRPGKVAVNAGGAVLILGELTPGAHLSAEVGIMKIKKKFAIGIGAETDITFIDPEIIGYHAGLRTALHYGDRNARNLDIYGGIGLGIPFYDEHSFVNPVFLNVFAGLRVLFTKRFGFFGELGLGATNARLGLTVII